MNKLLLLLALFSINAYALELHSHSMVYHNVKNFRICKSDLGVKFALRFSDVSSISDKSYNPFVTRIKEFAVSYDDGISYEPIGHVYLGDKGHSTGQVKEYERNGKYPYGTIYMHYSMLLKQVGKNKFEGVVDIYKDYNMRYSNIPSFVSKFLTKGPQFVTCEIL